MQIHAKNTRILMQKKPADFPIPPCRKSLNLKGNLLKTIAMKCFACALFFATLLPLNSALAAPDMKPNFQHYQLDYDTPVDPMLQAQLDDMDASLRAKYDMSTDDTAVGLLDLQTLRLAMIHPDHEDYAASVAKIGILFAYFKLRPAAATNLDAQARHELGLMIKPSSNEMAAKYSQLLGLKRIQQALKSSGFYDAKHGGGIWVGKHYWTGSRGQDGRRRRCRQPLHDPGPGRAGKGAITV